MYFELICKGKVAFWTCALRRCLPVVEMLELSDVEQMPQWN